MLVEEVSKMEPVDRFIYWIRERHNIHLRRRKGLPKPWTDDRVLQTIFFTNPYRENDKTTVWFREHVRDILPESKVLFATVAFRWFNLIRTGEILLNENLLTKWDEEKAVSILKKEMHKRPVFTGAYMIKAGNGPPGCKVPNVCASITNVWNDRKRLTDLCLKEQTLRSLWKEMCLFKHLGGFMSYEIVCDLRYTSLLRNATDVNTWTNPGPGALRGLLRLQGGVPKNRQVRISDPLPKMIELLHYTRKKLVKMPHFELREIEHSLCEFDKYERARLKDGRMKRVYRGY